MINLGGSKSGDFASMSNWVVSRIQDTELENLDKHLIIFFQRITPSSYSLINIVFPL